MQTKWSSNSPTFKYHQDVNLETKFLNIWTFGWYIQAMAVPSIYELFPKYKSNEQMTQWLHDNIISQRN